MLPLLTETSNVMTVPNNLLYRYCHEMPQRNKYEQEYDLSVVQPQR